MLPRFPVLPESVRFDDSTISANIIHIDEKGISPPCMIREPTHRPVKECIRFIIRANGNTDLLSEK